MMSSSPQDWEDAAQPTPIYLDHNATTPIDPAVADAMAPYLRGGFGNPSSPHRLGREAKRAVEDARAELAALLGAEPDEIVFTSGGTESNNLAILGTPLRGERRAAPGDLGGRAPGRPGTAPGTGTARLRCSLSCPWTPLAAWILATSPRRCARIPPWCP